MTAAATAWQPPTRLRAAWHGLKIVVHRARRGAINAWHGPLRIAPSQRLADAAVVAQHRSPLWIDGRADEFVLRCGKVQNLRVAVAHVDGVVVEAGRCVSFWSQVGQPSGARGFVKGREIVNGCVVPTIGGGLCQLSNALASAAVAAGVRLVERHRHSARIERASSDAFDEDATVAWNHIDLRLAADVDFRIEARLTHDELIVTLRASQPARTVLPVLRVRPVMPHASEVVPAHGERMRYAATARDAAPTTPRNTPRNTTATARGCMTCDQTSCFRHRHRPRPAAARIAYLLNDHSPELARWLIAQGCTADWMLPWVRPARRAQAWVVPTGDHAHVAWWAGCRRVVRQRLHRGEGAARQAGLQQAAVDLARHAARRLQPLHTDVVVTQDLLVPLWRTGALAGRAFDVFVPELPASVLQARLDAAAARSLAASLRDFRVDAAWQRDEWAALAAARTRLTPHADVMRVLHHAGLAVELLPWIEPSAVPAAAREGGRAIDRPLTLTLAGSALARKGANEVARVARKLGARVLILGSAPGDAKAWAGVAWDRVGYDSAWLEQSDVVLLPAWVEHRPRALLLALAHGVPVVASRACGLGPRAGLIEIEPGCADALEAAVASISSERDRRLTN